ncbi:MAG: (d)CMP kinase, partial [Bacilli bacterium]|nr:(d)CMP kinase [Bacilli bacterium]
MNKGRFIVVSGPSGVGKGTICNLLIKELNAQYSVSYTTRNP